MSGKNWAHIFNLTPANFWFWRIYTSFQNWVYYLYMYFENPTCSL